MSTEAARRVLTGAIAERAFPAATAEVGDSDGVLWSDALGALTFDAASPETRADTPFDLASLTKPIATATVAMELVRTGALRLDAGVAEFFDDWRATDRETVTVRDLLEHASGLPARLVDPPPATRREFEHDICTIGLEYAPRTQSIYSDLGFILLGFLLADAGGAPLDALFDSVRGVRLRPDRSMREVRLQPDGSMRGGRLQPDRSMRGGRLQPDRDADVRLKADATYLGFALPPALRSTAAPTLPMNADPRRGRRLAGEVHDDYAAALGGVAGHAGLFGTAAAVGAFARGVLRAARARAPLVRLFTTKSTVPGSSRALGWDTMLPTSSCGERMSTGAFGHVGFTGTSLWIDPDRDRYYVLLTNRVCGGGTLDHMRTVRRAFHDALAHL